MPEQKIAHLKRRTIKAGVLIPLVQAFQCEVGIGKPAIWCRA